MKRLNTLIAMCAVVSSLSGCAASDDSAEGSLGAPSLGVGQGGAQDFGEFRKILDDGEIPAPQTLDDVGFFNEHKIDLPPAECGQTVCLHAQLGVMGNMINGSNCTLVLLGMNTTLSPSELQRPPLDLIIAVDTSGSMQGEGISFVRQGLFRMLDALSEDDTVSLVGFSDRASIYGEDMLGTAAQLAEAIDRLEAQGQTNIYEGLRTAFDIALDGRDERRSTRVLLLSDGVATAGIQNDARLVELARSHADVGISLTTIGMGTDFNPDLMRELSEVGSGAFYFLEDQSAVVEVFEEEVKTFLVPLAEDVAIDLAIGDDYLLRRIYGTKDATVEASGTSGSIAIPRVQIAGRTSDDDNARGRRGGGGAIIAELMPRPEGGTPGRVGTVTLAYDATLGGEGRQQQETIIESALAPGVAPADGSFDDPSVEKAFVMLNIFAGFDMAAERAAQGDGAGAVRVLESLAPNVEAWLMENDDEDIENDLVYINRFISNLNAQGDFADGLRPLPEPWTPWPVD